MFALLPTSCCHVNPKHTKQAQTSCYRQIAKIWAFQLVCVLQALQSAGVVVHTAIHHVVMVIAAS